MRRGSSRRKSWAAEKLRTEGVQVGLLFLVGEERDSIGAKTANQHPIGARS